MLAMSLPRYTLQDFATITFSGFDIKLPDETLSIITDLAMQVGSPTYIKTPTFHKRDIKNNSEEYNLMMLNGNNNNGFEQPFKRKNRNGRNNGRNNEIINEDDWDSMKSFQATKIEVKGNIDLIRSALNKMTDKNYSEYFATIVDLLEQEIQNSSTEEIMRIGNAIFEIASNNRFYSKLYAELYTSLINKFSIMKQIFEDNLSSFLELFNTIEYVDSDKDYDKFCKNNKDNERRKALSAFFVNLMVNSIITKDKIVELSTSLLKQVVTLMKEENKKNEVDEMTENIAIFYNKSLFVQYKEPIYEGKTFSETIDMLARCKVKNHPSLSSKSIFKYMDIIDM